MIEFESLGKSYGDKAVLSAVDLSLPSIGLFFLLGPNGSGKTTFLSILSGRDKDFTGKFAYLGEPIDKSNNERYADNLVGYCPQDPLIFEDSDCLDNLLLPFAKKDKKKAAAILERVGLIPVAKSKAASLSSGEKQRLSLARVLYSDRPIALLDEPTSFLDKDNADIILGCLLEYSQNHLVVMTSNEEVPEEYRAQAGLLRCQNRTITMEKAAPGEGKTLEAVPAALRKSDGMLRLYKERPWFFSLYSLLSAVFVLLSTLFGTLFSSAVRDYSFDSTYPLHYPEIAIAQNADLLPFSYQLEFEPETEVYLLYTVLLQLEDPQYHPFYHFSSLLDLGRTENGPILDYVDGLDCLFGRKPMSHGEIAMPYMGYRDLASLYGYEPDDPDGFEAISDDFLIEFNSIPLRLVGVLDSPVMETIDQYWDYILDPKRHIPYADFVAATFFSTGGLVYCDPEYANYLNALTGTSAYYRSEENVRRIMEKKDEMTFFGSENGFPLAKNDGSEARTPLTQSPGSLLFCLSLYAAYPLIMGLVYCATSYRRNLLLRFAGASRKAGWRRTSSLFLLLTAGSMGLGMGLGVLTCYLVQAAFLSSLLGFQAPFLYFHLNTFLLILLTAILAACAVLLILRFTLFKADLSKDLYRVKEK